MRLMKSGVEAAMAWDAAAQKGPDDGTGNLVQTPLASGVGLPRVPPQEKWHRAVF